MKKRTLAALLAVLTLLCLAACGEKKPEIQKISWQAAPAYIPEAVPLPVETASLNGCCTDGENLYLLTEEREGDGKKFVLTRASLAEGTAEALPDFRPTEPPEGGLGSITGPVMAPDGTLWIYESWCVSYYDLPADFDEEREAKGKYLTRQDDFYHLRQLDPETGRELKLVDLSAAAQEVERALKNDTVRFALDGEGRICLAGSDRVVVLDSKGAVLFALEVNLPGSGIRGTAGSALVNLPDGSVAALTAPGGGRREVRAIDPKARDWGNERYAIDGQASLLYGGTGGFLFFYVDKGKLYAWEPEAEEPRELLSLYDARLESGLMCFAPLADGRLAALTSRHAGEAGGADYYNSIALSLLSPTDELPEKVKVTYGTFGVSGDIQARVNRFNQANEEYQIEIRDYFDGADPWGQSAEVEDAAKKRLMTDIAAGDIPDIWDSSLPLDLYARQGVFEDLWPWIDGDPELGRERVMEHVLDCAALDGKLYQVCGSFIINTAIGMPDVVGDRTSWTIEDLLAAYESLGPDAGILDRYMSSYYLLQSLIGEDLDRYVDWDTGECRFDSAEFKEVLELCARMPREPDYSRPSGDSIREGRLLLRDIQLLQPSHILYAEALGAGPEDLEDYKAYLNANHIYPTLIDENKNWREKEAMYCYALQDMERSQATGYLHGFQEEYYALAGDAAFGALRGGGYVSYIGYPTQGGAGSSFQTYNNLSMSAACQHKEGAWAFMRQVLLPGGSLQTDHSEYGDFTYSPGFPINKADFDEAMSPKWMENKSGEIMLDAAGERIEKPGDGLVALGAPCSMVLFDLAPTEPQLARFMELYNAIDHVTPDMFDFYELIREPAEAYWAGDKSLDETAALIQSRASIYVNEQR